MVVAEEKIILFLLIVVCVALGMFVGRYVLPHPSGGELILDTSDPETDKWMIVLHEAPERLTRHHQIVLDVSHRMIDKGDPKWPEEN